MLTRRLKPKEVAAGMNCCLATARIRMRQMVHTEKPLTVKESEVERWWNEHNQEPIKKTKKTTRPYSKHIKTEGNDKYLIPRKRPKP